MEVGGGRPTHLRRLGRGSQQPCRACDAWRCAEQRPTLMRLMVLPVQGAGAGGRGR